MFYAVLFVLLLTHTIFSFSNSKILKVVIPIITCLILLVISYEMGKAPYILKSNGSTYSYDNYNELQKHENELLAEKEEFVVEINSYNTRSKTECWHVGLLLILEIVVIYTINKMKERRKYENRMD